MLTEGQKLYREELDARLAVRVSSWQATRDELVFGDIYEDVMSFERNRATFYFGEDDAEEKLHDALLKCTRSFELGRGSFLAMYETSLRNMLRDKWRNADESGLGGTRRQAVKKIAEVTTQMVVEGLAIGADEVSRRSGVPIQTVKFLSRSGLGQDVPVSLDTLKESNRGMLTVKGTVVEVGKDGLENGVVERDFIDRIFERLSCLEPKHYGQALRYFVGGYSMEEIGKLLGIPLATVKTAIHRSREFLKVEIQEGRL